MVRVSSKVRSVLALAAAAALFGSCGGGGSNNPNGPGTPSPTPTPPVNSVRTVLMTGVPFILNPDTVMFRNVDNPPVGTLDISVDWPGSGDLNLYVTANSCSNFSDVLAGRCPTLGKSDGTAKPEVVRFNTTANQTYTVWIHNHSLSRESNTAPHTSPNRARSPTPSTVRFHPPLALHSTTCAFVKSGAATTPLRDRARPWYPYSMSVTVSSTL